MTQEQKDQELLLGAEKLMGKLLTMIEDSLPGYYYSSNIVALCDGWYKAYYEEFATSAEEEEFFNTLNQI